MTILHQIIKSGLRRIIKLCSVMLIGAAHTWPSAIATIWYKDFWEMREQLLRSSGFAKEFLISAYYSYMEKEKFFIGSHASFTSKPVFPHGIIGIFISEGAQLGSLCIIFPHTTIGSNTLHDSRGKGSPTIGDNCYIGSGATIIGGIHIGNNCRIGANSTVTESIPDNCVVVSQKSRIIKKTFLNNTWDPY
jgi:serine O-acetyltransferase